MMTLRRFLLVLALLAPAVTTTAGQLVSFRSGVQAPIFPLEVSADGHHFVDASGRPFPILGRNSWSLIEIPRADAQVFLDDTVDKGYTAIEIWGPNSYPEQLGNPATVNPWRDGANNLGWLLNLSGGVWTGSDRTFDFTTPNPAFFDSLEKLFEDARSRGLLVLWFPAYVGYDELPSQGVMNEMVANGTTKMEAYGAYVATRFAHVPNVMWMLGGDRGTGAIPFEGTEDDVEEAFIDGLQGVGGQASTFYTAEWLRESMAEDLYPAAINVNSVYAGATTIPYQADRAWTYAPTSPTFLLEVPFHRHPNGTAPSRRFFWWATISTRNGYFLGDWNYYLFNDGWEDELDDAGNLDAARLNAFWRSIPWWTLSPDAGFVTAGGGTNNQSSNYVGCATSSTLAVCYTPPDHAGSTTFDMTTFASGGIRVRKFDPTNAAYTTLATGVANTGTQSYTVSGTNNDEGTFDDWVVVFDIP